MDRSECERMCARGVVRRRANNFMTMETDTKSRALEHVCVCVCLCIHIWTVYVSMYLSSVHDIRMERSEPVEYCDIDCVNSCSDHWSEKCACIRDGNALPN